jgi:vitamin-K-epoxide reductase (warfarin-sensitive)
MNETIKKYLWAVFALSLIGLPVTAYLIYLHYVPEDASFCNFNETFNCDIVNKSQWSVIDLGFIEVPVAILGFLAYVFFAKMAFFLIKEVDFTRFIGFLSNKVILWTMLAASVIGFLFSAYLTYIEAFVLYAYCVFCLISQVLIAAIMVLLIMAVIKMRRLEKDVLM